MIEPFIIMTRLQLTIDNITAWFCPLIPKTQNDGLQLSVSQIGCENEASVYVDDQRMHPLLLNIYAIKCHLA